MIPSLVTNSKAVAKILELDTENSLLDQDWFSCGFASILDVL